MDVNRETAMRIWTKRYGKDLKVQDFAGRTMVKSAYDDRNSDYGWNLDHVFPQSKGGVTAEHNLVCCHILTNDEKADSFPCFKANGHEFEIHRVQNHYEIQEKHSSLADNPKEDENPVPNFFDAASGLELFDDLLQLQEKPRHTSRIVITLENLKSTAVVDFIEKLFSDSGITYIPSNYRSTLYISIQKTDVPLKEDSALLLDKCIVLNTYLSSYFEPLRYFAAYDIHYEDCCLDRNNMYRLSMLSEDDIKWQPTNSMFINDAVIQNTNAKDRIKNPTKGFNEYNYVYTKLQDDLRKEVNRQN